MNRLLAWAICLVVMVFGLQWMVPRWVGGAAAEWLGREWKSPKPLVEVSALPFWQLASGRFQVLFVRGRNAEVHGVVVRAFHLTWLHGQIGLDQQGQPVRVKQVGALTGEVEVSLAELAHLLVQRGMMEHSTVSLEDGVLQIAGTLRVGGHSLGLTVRGPLRLAHHGASVVFSPEQLDGAKWPLTTTIIVFSLSELHLPIALELTRLSTTSTGLALGFRNR